MFVVGGEREHWHRPPPEPQLWERAEAQGQIGNRWGHRAKPETPDPEGEGRQGRVGRRGGPTQAANPSRRCGPGAGLKAPRERPGIRRPGQVLGLGEVVREGREA